MKRVLHIVVAFFLVVPITTIEAGDRSNVRGMGMGRTLAATSWGVDALGINPANLSMSDYGAFSLNILPFGLRMSSQLVSYEIYDKYFTGVPDATGGRQPKYLTKEDKEDILNAFPSGFAATRFDLDVMLIGASVRTSKLGAFGFAMKEHIGGRFDFPRDYARMFLFGLDSAGSRYVFDGTSLSAWWWREYNVSYAMRLPLRLKLLHGYGMFETVHYRASIANERVSTNQYRAQLVFDYLTRRSGIGVFNEDSDSEFFFFPSPAGTGFGFDVGTVWNYQFLSVHASICDIGKISWKNNIVETYGKYDLSLEDPFDEANADSIESAFRGENRQGRSFSTNLPTTLRLGFILYSDKVQSLKALPGSFVVALDYTQGLNESMGNVTSPRVSAGIEYRLISVLPFRTGISLGGGDGFRWAAGFGLDLHYWSLDLATENFGMLFSPHNFDMFSFALGMRIRI